MEAEHPCHKYVERSWNPSVQWFCHLLYGVILQCLPVLYFWVFSFSFAINVVGSNELKMHIFNS